jgi:hypothetical protein
MDRSQPSADNSVVSRNLHGAGCRCPQSRIDRGLPCFETMPRDAESSLVQGSRGFASYEAAKAAHPGYAIVGTKSGMGHGPMRYGPRKKLKPNDSEHCVGGLSRVDSRTFEVADGLDLVMDDCGRPHYALVSRSADAPDWPAHEIESVLKHKGINVWCDEATWHNEGDWSSVLVHEGGYHENAGGSVRRNDYLIRKQRNGRYYIYAFDAWTDDVGSLVEQARGYESEGDAATAAAKHAHRSGTNSAVVARENTDGTTTQIGNTMGSRFERGGMSNNGHRRNAMRIAQDDLWLCQDCMIVAVNDDPSGIEDDERVEEVYAGLKELGPHLVPDFDSETDEGHLEFSSRGCDCCGSGLAGELWRFATLEEDPERPYKANSSEQYWVWALDRSGKPLTSEGPWGPYDYQGARSYARISATKGSHDRAVSHGKDPSAHSFEIMRVYRAGTGEHKYGVAQRLGAPMEANATEHWQKGARYDTSYGIAKVVKTNGKFAEFRIVRVAPEAARMGYHNGSFFTAHIDDLTAPSPRTWQLVSD